MPSEKKKGSFLARTLIMAVAIYVTAAIVKGVDISGFGAAVVASVLLALVNALIKPVAVLLSLPVNILTFGLFTFVINGILLLLVSSFTIGFYVSGLWAAIIASVIISVVNALISAFVY
jgi:putative membrane protein